MLLDFGTVDMTSPVTANARVYIGNLSEGTETEDLLEIFSKYGTIVGIKNYRHYAFIQFSTDASAQAAIGDTQKIHCKGRKLLVRSANKLKKGNTGGSGAGNNSQDQIEEEEYTEDINVPGGSRDNWQEEEHEERWPESGRGIGRGGRGGRGRGFRGRGAPLLGRAPYRDRSPINNGGSWQESSYDRFPPSNNVFRPVAPERNDCEIIVVSKMLTEYAEFIEDKLKRIGLVVDLLFPNEDVPIGRVLGNISSRGCLYAILVMPQNQEHRSLTLNILHGLPQEHRNMPLDDAISLVARNYTEYQRTGSAAGREAVVALLSQLANGSTLTVLQYDTILTYVKECREKQVKIELGVTAIDTTTAKTQVDLQQRIMSILNSDKPPESTSSKQTLPSMGESSLQNLNRKEINEESQNDLRQRIANVLNTVTPQPVPAPSIKTAAPILSNPSVQKALDSLLSNII